MYESNEMLDRFGLTLERERVLMKYSQNEMACALGLSVSSYKRILNGEKLKLGIITLRRIETMTGRFIDELCNISSTVNDCLPLLRRLTERQLCFLKGIMRFEISLTVSTVDTDMSTDIVTLIVPTGNMHDGMIYDSCNLKTLDISPYRLRFGQIIDCALLVTSCHMQPAYQKNDILLLSSGPIRDGDTGVFIENRTGRIFLRKYLQTEPIRMEPVVSYGHTFLVDNKSNEEQSRWTKIGYVIAKMR